MTRSQKKNLVGIVVAMAAYHFLLPWVVEGGAVSVLLAPAGIGALPRAFAAVAVLLLRLVTVFVVPGVALWLALAALARVWETVQGNRAASCETSVR